MKVLKYEAKNSVYLDEIEKRILGAFKNNTEVLSLEEVSKRINEPSWDKVQSNLMMLIIKKLVELLPAPRNVIGVGFFRRR